MEDIEDSEEAPLTVEDIKDAEEEFGFLDPSLLMHLDEPISEEIISIPRNLNEVEETDEIEEIEKPEDTDEIDEIEEPEELRIFAPEQIIDPIDPLEEEYSPDIYLYADEEEDGDEDLTFDDLVTDEDADDGLVYENISLESESDDEDLTFDDLATEDNADDGVVYELLSLDDNGEDDDLTFDQLEEAVSEEENDENISYTPILMDSLEQESAESFLGDYFASDSSPLTAVSEVEIDVDAVRERIENAESDSDDDLPWYEDESAEEIIHNTSYEEDDGIGEPEESADFGEFDAEEEFGGFGEGDELGAYHSAPEKPSEYQVSGADISLLLQFGCDDEVLSIASDEDIESLSNEDALEKISESIPDDDQDEQNPDRSPKEALEDKILRIYNNYSSERGGVLLRLIAASAIAFLLLLYDLLPMLGVRLPGIMDRDFYFMSHVLIGMQLLIIAALTSGKRLLRGLKKLFTRGADAYSAVSVLIIGVLLYDITIMTVSVDRPPVFHFLAAMAIVMAVAAECAELSANMMVYKFFFSDMIARADGEVMADSENRSRRYTLHRSSGEGSVAEKMYRGGLDTSQSIYSPLEIESTAGYFNAAEKKSRKAHAPMAVLLPSLVFSTIMGIIAFVVTGENGELWMCFGASLLSMTLTLPVLAIFSTWLPISHINRKSLRSGFAFASEHSAEQYTDCNVFVFEDMHMLEKRLPKSVNLAVYDATSSDVLLGCLDALYSKIGGPLAETFATADASKSFGECQVKRIAKSGVEALIGTNYAILVGNEQFMARYGITFPQVTFKNSGDEIYSLCVSVNGRASARIVTKYSTNEIFEMLSQRLSEDGVYCAVETFDPMLSTELLKKIRGEERPPVSVVHLGVDDLSSSRTHRERTLFDASSADIGVLAKGSRLNLVIAVSSAIRTKLLRRRVNLYCYLSAALGSVLSLFSVLSASMGGVNEFLIVLYWLLSIGGLIALVVTGAPKSDRFSIERFRFEETCYYTSDEEDKAQSEQNQKRS